MPPTAGRVGAKTVGLGELGVLLGKLGRCGVNPCTGQNDRSETVSAQLWNFLCPPAPPNPGNPTIRECVFGFVGMLH